MKEILKMFAPNRVLAFLIAAMVTIVSGQLVASENELPNFVVIFLDDAGYGDFGCYGHPTIKTPHIDQMASQGMKFTQFYSASPACSASRYGLLTGRYPIRSGFPWVLVPKSQRGVHEKEVTIAEALKDRGYSTACIGKWHLGNKHEFLPLQNGFDEYFGLPYSNDMIPPRWPEIPLIDGNEPVEESPDQDKLTRRYTERTIDFITANKDKPFFCYLAHAMPHLPLHTSDRFRGKSKRGLYGDVIEEIDWSVGQVISHLKKLELDKKTLVVFTSDNGPWIIKNLEGGSSGLLRDGKGSTWEGGMRVPGIAWWPETIKPMSVCDTVASTLDLFPTLVELSGGELPSDRTIDGFSLVQVFNGTSPSTERESMFYFGPGNKLHAIRKNEWKLHLKTSSQTRKKYFEGKVPLLFNLDHDPSEQHDVSESNPEKVAELQKDVGDFVESLKHEPSFWANASSKQAEQFVSIQASAQPETKSESPFVQVLGIAQDAGFPQAGCRKACCKDAWADSSLQRFATSLAIVDPKEKQRWLVECTPDFREQFHYLDNATSEPDDEVQGGLDGILLTHAHIGHYAGLIHLGREVMGTRGVDVFCMPRMKQFLTTNGPWSQLVELNNISLVSIDAGKQFELNSKIRVTPIVVPHRDEFSETVAYRIDGPKKAILFLPDIDKWERWEQSIEELIKEVDVAYLDATFFGENELPGRNMSEIPHPFVVESIKRFSSLDRSDRAKIRFIHLNHTNPALKKDSTARHQIESAGMQVAEQFEIVELD